MKKIYALPLIAIVIAGCATPRGSSQPVQQIGNEIYDQDQKGCKHLAAGAGNNVWYRGGIIITWTGGCVNGYAQGEGIEQSLIGRHVEYQYIGEKWGGKRHGNGHLKSADGSIRQGQFKEGFLHGQGTYNNKSGSIKYSGGWEKGVKHGQGTESIESSVAGRSSWYEGEWKNNVHHGQGTERLADGSWYKGEWVDGERHGQGESRNATGDEHYIGEWKNGNKIGKSNKDLATEKKQQEDAQKTLKKAQLLVGKRIKWVENQSVESDDCVSLFFKRVCHTVSYRFRFTGVVLSIDNQKKEYSVKVDSVELIPQEYVAPMYWHYKERALNSGAQQKGSIKSIGVGFAEPAK